jgi:Carboxypeptidase regulatory-like domain
VLGAAAALFQAAGTSAAASVRGTIAGKVYDSKSRSLLPQVTVSARTLGIEESFEAVTDASGTYRLTGAPAAVYSFTLTSGGLEVPVKERMDLRVSMPFLLESCFELDAEKKTASVRAECSSGFVEEARVATIGPHRFLLPDRFQEQPAAGDVAQPMPTAIEHPGIECLTHDHYPRVDAGIQPGDKVQTSRVYFRSDKYPDFYYIEMTKEHPTIDDFQGILPKPGPETERIIYYLESVDTNFESLQTPEFAPEVIDADECRRRGAPAWFEGEPSIVVGATTPGAAAIPPGFQAVGITGFVNSLGILSSIGGGAGGVVGSTAGAVLIVGGAAAAATGVVVATGGDEASPPR